MSKSQNGENGEERTHDWHPLPQLIGNAVTGEIEEIANCGNWAVEVEDGEVLIYTVIDQAEEKDELPEAAKIRRLWDHYLALELHAKLPEPEFGWESETESIEESIWGGYR